MNEGLKKLLEAMKTQEDLGDKFAQCKTPEEAYHVALEVSDGYTIEEFQAMMAEIKKLNDGVAELSEEDLDSVSGGSDLELGLTIAGSIIGGAGTIIGAAVSASAASM